MKDLLKNRKGFTLVELLAVIVVLAIIILIALPAVLNSMEKARRNSFAIEANEFVKAAETGYSMAVLNGLPAGKDINLNKEDDTTENDNEEGEHVSRYCVNFSDLKTGGFIKKDDKSYGGIVILDIAEDGDVKTKVTLTNNSHSVKEIEGTVENNEVKSTTLDKDSIEKCKDNDNNSPGTSLARYLENAVESY